MRSISSTTARFRSSALIFGSYGAATGAASSVPQNDLAELLPRLQAGQRPVVLVEGHDGVDRDRQAGLDEPEGVGELLVAAHRRADDLELLEEQARQVELDLGARRAAA